MSWWPLAAILAATVIFYAPVLNDWFFADDFMFLRYARDTSWGDWLLQSFDYREPRPVPVLNSWRPMYFLVFKAEYSLFGEHATAYHLANLAIHLANVTVLWLIVRRLPVEPWAAHVAAIIFALHPEPTEAVAWIVNGNTPMAMLVALLALLWFMKFTDAGALWWIAAATLAFTIALLMHPIVLPMGLTIAAWHVLVHHDGSNLFRPPAWRALVPLVAVAVPYTLIQRWVRGHDFHHLINYQFGSHMFDNTRDYLALSLHVKPDSALAPVAVGTMIVISLLALVPWRARMPWLGIFALGWFYGSLGPDSVYVFGAQPRLFYAPAAGLGVLVAVTASEIVAWLNEHRPSIARPATFAGAAAALVAAVILVRINDDRRWPPSTALVSDQAALNERFLADLRTAAPPVQDGGTLYVVNPPPFLVHLGLEDILESLVRLYYRDVDVEPVPLRNPPFWDEAQVRQNLGPGDAIFVFNPGP